MKKGFGWFFVILGALNLFRGIVMLDAGMDHGGGLLVMAIAFVGLGAWMISTADKNKKTG
jgi:hypothetical protein